MDYDKTAKLYIESGGVLSPPSAYDSCRTCHGSGLEVIGGRTPEGDVMDDVECSACKGTGKRQPR